MNEQSKAAFQQINQNLSEKYSEAYNNAVSASEYLNSAASELKEKSEECGIYGSQTVQAVAEVLEMCINKIEECKNNIEFLKNNIGNV